MVALISDMASDLARPSIATPRSGVSRVVAIRRQCLQGTPSAWPVLRLLAPQRTVPERSKTAAVNLLIVGGAPRRSARPALQPLPSVDSTSLRGLREWSDRLQAEARVFEQFRETTRQFHCSHVVRRRDTGRVASIRRGAAPSMRSGTLPFKRSLKTKSYGSPPYAKRRAPPPGPPVHFRASER
jgi:hypothetical protein